MQNSRFFDVECRSMNTAAGPYELPILYKDASLLTIVVPVDATRASACLPPAFEPWVVLGKAIAVLCAFEYRDTTIGPYSELGVGVLVRRAGRFPSFFRFARDMRREEDAGLYVTNLPVTTEAARAAGADLWGYPRYVTGIETIFREADVRIVLEKEVDIRAKRGRGPTSRALPIVTYSLKGGRVIRTVVEVDHAIRWGGARSVSIKLLGDGPTARTIAALGMDVRTPIAAYCTDHMRSILPLGKDLGSVPTRGAQVERGTSGARAHHEGAA
jgi:hypothetical protein